MLQNHLSVVSGRFSHNAQLKRTSYSRKYRFASIRRRRTFTINFHMHSVSFNCTFLPFKFKSFLTSEIIVVITYEYSASPKYNYNKKLVMLYFRIINKFLLRITLILKLSIFRFGKYTIVSHFFL